MNSAAVALLLLSSTFVSKQKFFQAACGLRTRHTGVGDTLAVLARNILGKSKGLNELEPEPMIDQIPLRNRTFPLPPIYASALGYDPYTKVDLDEVKDLVEGSLGQGEASDESKKGVEPERISDEEEEQIEASSEGGEKIDKELFAKVQRNMVEQRNAFRAIDESVSALRDSMSKLQDQAKKKISTVKGGNMLTLRIQYDNPKSLGPEAEARSKKGSPSSSKFTPIDVDTWNRNIPVVYSRPDGFGDLLAAQHLLDVEHKMLHIIRVGELLGMYKANVPAKSVIPLVQTALDDYSANARFFKAEMELQESQLRNIAKVSP